MAINPFMWGNPSAVGQQTAAGQMLMTRSPGSGVKRTRTRKRKASALAPRKRKASSAKRKPARLVKGSAAAKRYMASIRRKRRK